jgi:uncharacterized membrane protein (DUF485 family)
MTMLNDPLQQIEQVTKETNRYMAVRAKNAFAKYPITFSLLVLFGVMAVMHGFEGLVIQVPFFVNHPGVLFLIGLIILILTGTLYKRLNKKLD